MEKNKSGEGKKRYWLRGGVVGLIVYAILLLIGIIWFGYHMMFFILTGLPWSAIILIIPKIVDKIGIITTGLNAFIIGAIIGYIYGKIKQRKENVK